MRRLYRTFVIAALLLPAAFAQRVLSTMPLPFLSGRDFLGVAKDAAGNNYIASGDSVDMPPLGHHLTGVGHITKITPSGQQLYETTFSCCIGAYQFQMAIDAQTNLVFVARAAPGISTKNALQPTAKAGAVDQPIVGKLNPSGELQFLTYFGGSLNTQVNALALDSAGDIYLAGFTQDADFPTTPGAYRTSLSAAPNAADAFVTKIRAAGDHLVYSTYFGGTTARTLPPGYSKTDFIYGLAVDANGSAYAVGSSNANDYPVTADALAAPSEASGFLAKLDAAGAKLLYSTRLPMPDSTFQSIALDVQGAVYLAGTGPTYNVGALLKLVPGETQPRYSVPLFGFIKHLTLSSSTELTVSGFNSTQGFVARLRTSDGDIVTNKIFPPLAGQQTNLSPTGDAVLIANTDSASEWLSNFSAAPSSTPSILGAGSSAVLGVTRKVSAGEIISIYGTFLGPETPAVTTLDATGNVSTSLAGVRVSFDGLPAPLLYVSRDQINAVTPFGIAGRASVTMTVETAAGSAAASVSVVESQPAPFLNPQNPLTAAALDEKGNVISDTNQPKPGSVVSLFATGLGPLTPSVADGSVNAVPLPRLQLPLRVRLVAAGVSSLPPNPAKDGDLEILYAGPAPGSVAGAHQINVRLPAGSPTRGYWRVYLMAGETFGPVVWIPVNIF